MPDYLTFSDFAEKPDLLDGGKKKIKDIVDIKILVSNYKIKPSKQKENSFYATIQFKIDEVKYIFFTGSEVLIDQIEKYKDHLPFYTQIKKVNKYYTFT